MTYSFPLPEAFSAYRLDDALLAEAYEALGPERRAVLKTTIAALHAIWREQRETTRLTRCLPEGYTVCQESKPASYALVVCEAAYPSPACFLAAAMPALLAGVGLVIPCFVGGAGHPPAALAPLAPLAPLATATELAGLEEALALPDEAQLLPLLQALHGHGAAGRLVVMGRKPLAREALVYALEQGIPCLSLTRPPYFHLVGGMDGKTAPADPSFPMTSVASMPETSCTACAAGANASPHDAAHRENAAWPNFSWAEQAGIATAAPCDLELEGGLANLWVWPGLDPAWFMNRRMRVSAGAPAPYPL